MTMFDEVLSLGGVVRQSNKMSIWQKHYADNGIRDEVLPMSEQNTASQSSGEGLPLRGETTRLVADLSTCHISPKIEWRVGASLLKVQRQPKVEQEEGEGEEEKQGNGETGKNGARLLDFRQSQE